MYRYSEAGRQWFSSVPKLLKFERQECGYLERGRGKKSGKFPEVFVERDITYLWLRVWWMREPGQRREVARQTMWIVWRMRLIANVTPLHRGFRLSSVGRRATLLEEIGGGRRRSHARSVTQDPGAGGSGRLRNRSYGQIHLRERRADPGEAGKPVL